MPTYLAFLRAINLGPNRKFPKADIVRAVEAAGMTNVQTHIASGNVRFDTAMRSRERIASALEAAFAADRGFEVPTIVFRADEFAAIAADAEKLGAENPGVARHYVYLLKHEPTAETVARVAATATDAGEMVIRGRAAHALLQPGYQDGQVDPLGAAKLLEPATNRNAGVVVAIAAKWC
ncbi:DUF1697 domain-containing protein [Microbacterium hominis]|uniref:DUF1697 domain-containing protein n=1 Tax=Microbacterium hominis TaxID=162426 RepID=A0A7D4Q6F8_9MICO|nr:DUF1697 domain-containing protein [Microbacterium hominis]QKJ18159.1 DUF1697 domain-containing protein [Microbacterium hominis]